MSGLVNELTSLQVDELIVFLVDELTSLQVHQLIAFKRKVHFLVYSSPCQLVSSYLFILLQLIPVAFFFFEFVHGNVGGDATVEQGTHAV